MFGSYDSYIISLLVLLNLILLFFILKKDWSIHNIINIIREYVNFFNRKR